MKKPDVIPLDLSDKPVRKLSLKQKLFVDSYFANNFNGTQAMIDAGYSARTAHSAVSRMLSNVVVQRAIQQRMAQLSAKYEVDANEVLRLLVSHMRGTFADFIDVTTGRIDFEKAKAANQLHLIRRFRGRETTIINDKLETETHIVECEIEMYDAQAAAEKLGKHLALFNNKLDITVDVKKLSDEELLRIASGEKP